MPQFLLKKFLHSKSLTFLLAVFSFVSVAQRGYNWEFGGGVGLSNYLGEIGGRNKDARPLFLDAKIAKSRWNPQAFVRYKFDPLFSVRVSANYLRIAGDDALTTSPGRRYRNLSFRNDIFDVEAAVQFLFFNSGSPIGVYSRSKVFFTAYLTAGIGAFHHSPKAFYQGSWVALQPLQTEGVFYSKWGYCVPLGIGGYVTINKRRKSHRVGLEVNWRYTNTDYLDDVSTTYKNPAELSSSLSGVLSNRNPEVERQPEGFSGNYGWHGTDKDGNPVNKAKRGDSSDKDSFFSINVYYAVAIKSIRHRPGKGKGRKVRSVTF